MSRSQDSNTGSGTLRDNGLAENAIFLLKEFVFSYLSVAFGGIIIRARVLVSNFFRKNFEKGKGSDLCLY